MYEGYLTSVKETLLVLKNRIETQGLNKSHFVDLLAEKEHGLAAILALTGFSNEFFKRLITIIRAVEDPELSTLVLKDRWSAIVPVENISEWGDKTIHRLIRTNEHFRMGVVNIFFEGATNPFLAKTIPLFELKKLGVLKLGFDTPAMIDTLIRYKEKGSYSGNKENNPEGLISELLDELEITFESGDLNQLVKKAFETKRTMDFIIPSKDNPQVIVESSFLATTSSGQGDKAKTEIAVSKLIKKHYPKAKFIGFIDGVGWYVRKKDSRRMVTAFDDVFTFDKSELARFEKFLIEEIKR
jgi:hypothetical protein